MTRRVEQRFNYADKQVDVRTDGSGNGQLSVHAVRAVPKNHLAAQFRYPVLLVLEGNVRAVRYATGMECEYGNVSLRFCRACAGRRAGWRRRRGRGPPGSRPARR